MSALQLADALAADEISVANRAVSDELRRLHAVNAQMLEALRGLDEAYCRAGSPLSRGERHEDRMRLIAARAAIAAATGEQA